MQRVNFPYQIAYDEGYHHALMDAENWLRFIQLTLFWLVPPLSLLSKYTRS